MNLSTLDYDNWFLEQANTILQPGQHIARVMTVDRNAYLVSYENGMVPAEVSGKFRFGIESNEDIPCVGDWVCIEQASPTLAIIHAVLPRKTYIRRKCSGKTVDFQMIAANIDIACIIQSCHYDFNIRRLERYLVVAHEGHIEPTIILSKTDLVTPTELDTMIQEIKNHGITAPILPISNTTGDGLESLQQLLEKGKTYCLLGSSGVGKTTLINQLLGQHVLDTKSVSETGEGVHTTSRRQLLMLANGAMLIDTPGMRELGLLGTHDGLDNSFSEIADLSTQCRFVDCTHTQEPGCAVLNAVEIGELNEDRYHSYLKLKKETDYHDMSYVEKRKKDKDFGRFIKSFKKHKQY